ncbi:hypothetical protein D9758_018288 [Tetrapyrgos nigripes]|uniref:F-box domain-containing protein n=1 Tax=Tetrapyrgos nigripes TaxID=182062 RepID=A0A8H5F031_9AGAR|nr:hypothetical protein D9758_018288 [Tetrapyrgos nigripes]
MAIPSNPDYPDILTSLRSNFGTYTSDVRDFSKCLHDAEYSASQIESKIISLRNEQQKIFLLIDRYRSLLAPIRRLPPEILLRVFVLCCPESKVAKEMDCPVVRLSQVCAGWRDLALKTSSLWAAMRIDLYHSKHDMLKINRMINAHLTLSRRSPLHLSFVLPHASVDKAQAVVDLLVRHCARWGSLSLDVSQGVLLYPSLAAVKDNLPLLERLELWPPSSYEIEYSTTQSILGLFSVAPMLRYLNLGSLDHASDAVETTDVQVPWAQLIDLTLWYQQPSNILRRLSQASAARTVIIDCCYVSETVQSDHALVHNMENLTICVDRFDPHFNFYLQQLTLPRLKCLCLSGEDNSKAIFPSASMLIFLTRSACSLTTLRLLNLYNSDLTVLNVLQEVPSLLHLTIHEHPIKGGDGNTTLTDHFIDRISFNHRSSSCSSHLLHHLQSLSLQVRQPFNVSSFVRMVQSRWLVSETDAKVLGLRQVELICVGTIPSEFEEAVRSLKMLKVVGLRFGLTSRDAK